MADVGLQTDSRDSVRMSAEQPRASSVRISMGSTGSGGSANPAPVVWDRYGKNSINKVAPEAVSNDAVVEPSNSDSVATAVPATMPSTENMTEEELRAFARRSLASAGDPPPPPKPTKPQGNVFEDVLGIAIAVPDDPSADAETPAEVYYVDASGKAMVTKKTTHKGRPASVTMQVGPDGRVMQVLGGTAQLPGESRRQYFRKMSSFAIWQLHETPGSTAIRWNGDQKYAYFCYVVILITGILLAVELGVNGGVEPFGVNPTFGPTRDVLVRLGAKKTSLIISQGQFYRLISSWWLHGGILHWVVNMLALINIGFSLEKEFGTPKITLIFCICGFMGALCSCVFLPETVGVGASGAIFGLFGSCFADLIQNWGLYKSRGNAKSTLCQLVFGAILNFLLGLIPVLDQFAHMGGFFTGISLGFVLLLQKRFTRFGEEKTFKRRQRLLQMCGLITTPIAMMVLLIVLYRGVDVDGWCSFCKYINCVPIANLWTCDDSGCSDDPSVKGIPYPNSTMDVYCPVSTTRGHIINTPIDRAPTEQDVVAACLALCFN